MKVVWWWWWWCGIDGCGGGHGVGDYGGGGGSCGVVVVALVVTAYLQKKFSRLQMKIFLLNRLRYARAGRMTNVIAYNMFFFIIWMSKGFLLNLEE